MLDNFTKSYEIYLKFLWDTLEKLLKQEEATFWISLKSLQMPAASFMYTAECIEARLYIFNVFNNSSEFVSQSFKIC